MRFSAKRRLASTRRICYAGLVASCLVAARARAEINGADTLEWLSCKADVIAVGEVAQCATWRRVGGGPASYDCTLRVSEMIKGEPVTELAFTIDTYPERPQPLGNLLVFLSPLRSESRAGRDDPYRHVTDEAWKHHHLVPTNDRSPFSVIQLRTPPALFDRDGRRIGPRAILPLVRTWAKSSITGFLERETSGTDADRELSAGSMVYLRVPAEEKYRWELMERAQNGKGSERAQPAGELGNYPGPATEVLLLELMNDPTEERAQAAADEISFIRFPVRSAASAALRQLGLRIPELPIERQPTLQERQQLREEYWTESFQRALPDGWRVASVTDDPTTTGAARGMGRDPAVVRVELKGSDGASFILKLFPKEWPRAELPSTGALGIYGFDSQGGRIFFAEGTIPDDVKSRILQQYRLKEFP